jgi:hypothetical protein
VPSPIREGRHVAKLKAARDRKIAAGEKCAPVRATPKRGLTSVSLIDVQHDPTTTFNSIADSLHVGETSLDYVRSKFGR